MYVYYIYGERFHVYLGLENDSETGVGLKVPCTPK